MKKILHCLCLALLLWSLPARADEQTPVTFGKIEPKDFAAGAADTAGAVVIADVAGATFQSSQLGKDALLYTRYKRIKIISQKGLDAAVVNILLYKGGDLADEVTSLQANTYNLENGSVVTTSLDRKSVYNDKLNENVTLEKFTFPAAKAGSVIEFIYTVLSPNVMSVPSWSFQGKYPTLWSEYNISIPEIYDFISLKQGDLSYSFQTRKEDIAHFWNTGGPNLHFANLRWVIKNAPPVEEEKFSIAEDHVTKIFFRYSGDHYIGAKYRPYMKDWPAASQLILAQSNFGAGLDAKNKWLHEAIDNVCTGAATPLEKARHVYEYVQNNFSGTSSYGIFLSNTPEKFFLKKTGTVADVNMLLITMLRRCNISADPVILSTRGHSEAIDDYPLLGRYNYVMCRAVIDGDTYYLDAAHPELGFGRIMPECYNGVARVISNVKSEPVLFDADSLTEKKVTSVSIAQGDAKTGPMQARVMTAASEAESLELRRIIKKKGQEEDYFKKINAQYPDDVHPADLQLKDGTPVTISYNYTLNPPTDDLWYFNPMPGYGVKENMFKPGRRIYPVELPYKTITVYKLDFEIPAGYTIEELPQAEHFVLNESAATYDYLINTAEGHIYLQSILKFNTATFAPEDYDKLSQFMGAVINKQAGMIVFRKTSATTAAAAPEALGAKKGPPVATHKLPAKK